jgi:hypothetical protein
MSLKHNFTRTLNIENSYSQTIEDVLLLLKIIKPFDQHAIGIIWWVFINSIIQIEFKNLFWAFPDEASSRK